MRFWPLLFIACTHPDPAPIAPAPIASPTATPAPNSFAKEIRAVYLGYRPWGRVDDELRWAPYLCRLQTPGMPHESRAKEGPHEQKLYSLFASDRDAYLAGEVAPGFAIVKESYVPERVENTGVVRFGHEGLDIDHFDPYVRGANGSMYKASRFAGAFVMKKLPKDTPDTDEGWVYGTMDASGQLTASGRIASCMGCHTTRPGRLFTVGKP